MALKIYTSKNKFSSPKLNRSKLFTQKQTLKKPLKSVNYDRNLTFIQRLNKANTGFFRFIGVFSFSLLFFISFNLLNGQQNTNATTAQASIINTYVEVTPVKKDASMLTSKTVEKVAAPTEIKSTVKVEKYTVKNGDTLSEVCAKLEVRCSELIQRNKLEAPFTLKIGQVLDYIK